MDEAASELAPVDVSTVVTPSVLPSKVKHDEPDRGLGDETTISLMLALPAAAILLVVFSLITALVSCRIKKKFASQDPKLIYYCSSMDPAFVILEMSSKCDIDVNDLLFASSDKCRCHGNDASSVCAEEKTSAGSEKVVLCRGRSFSEGDLNGKPLSISPTPSTYTSGTFSVDDVKALGTHENGHVLSQSEVSINVHSCPSSPLCQFRPSRETIGVLNTGGHPHFYAGSGIFIPLSASEAHLVNMTSENRTSDVIARSDDVINGCYEKRSYAMLAYRMGQHRLDDKWEMRTNL